jgi:hypothetical protein
MLRLVKCKSKLRCKRQTNDIISTARRIHARFNSSSSFHYFVTFPAAARATTHGAVIRSAASGDARHYLRTDISPSFDVNAAARGDFCTLWSRGRVEMEQGVPNKKEADR